MIVHQIANSYGNYHYNAYIYQDIIWEAHFHGNYELVYSMEGTTELKVNGIKERMSAGEMYLISPYLIHSLRIPKESKTWIGVFSSDFIADFAEKYSFRIFSKFKCDPEIADFLKERLFIKTLPERRTHTARLYLACGQHLQHSQISVPNGDSDFIRKTVIYISEHLENNITMKEAAETLNTEIFT